jgi:spermidine synthase
LDMYRAAARRLTDGGLYCQWLPLYQLTREEFEIIARTFVAAFPHVTLWRSDFYPNRPVLGLVGARQQPRADFDLIGRRLAALPEWSRDSLLTAPPAVAMLYLGDLSLVPGLIPDGAVNRDEHPVIEFMAPRLTRMSASGDKDWLMGAALADYTEAMRRKLGDHVESTLPATPVATDARRAGLTLFRYALAATRGDTAQADALMREVNRLVPDVVAAAREGTASGLADVRRTLDSLRSEQERLRQQLQSIERRFRTPTPDPDRR